MGLTVVLVGVCLLPGLAVLASPLEDSLESGQYETHYACEDSRLNITCQGGLHLNIIRANYGRFSIAICNNHGNTDWSVNCMSPRTLRVIKARCQGGVHCHVPVDSTIFGDPCPGTFKYIEVHYSCDKELTPSSTRRPRPPWFPENPPNSWASFDKQDTNTSQTVTSTEQTDHTTLTSVNTTPDTDTEDVEDESLPEMDQTPRVIKVKVPKPADYGEAGAEADSRVVAISNFTHYCAPAQARGLFWNWTAGGDTAVLQCPHDSSGFAKWQCRGGQSVGWASLSPSLAECQSRWLNNLDTRLREGEDIAGISSDLAEMSGQQSLYGGDLQLSTRMLKHMAERMHFDIQAVAEVRERERMVTELVQNVVSTASNILDKINHMSWADLTSDDVAAAATSLMIGLEENAFLVADAVTTEKIIIKPTPNILLSIRVMQARNTQSQRFPTVENLEMWDNQEDSIELTSQSLLDNSENGAVRIIFATYNEFDQLLIPSQRPNASLRFVNSKVISASLGKGRHTALQDPVKITLKHLRTENVSRPVCVFWDYTVQSWSNDGCRLVGGNVSHSQCQCSHLTNFALIMEEGPGLPGLTGSDNSGLSVTVSSKVTTIIACVASLICVSLLMFGLVLTWRKLRMSHQCRDMLQKSGIPCFHKTKELSEKDKKQGNFYTVTPKLNGSVNNNPGKPEANIEMDNQQYFEHMIAMQKNQENLVLNKTMSRRQSNGVAGGDQETQLTEMDLSKPSTLNSLNLNNPTSPVGAGQTLNNKMIYKAKTKCHHVTPNTFQLGMNNELVYPKKSNLSRAMSPLNHIYMEIDPRSEDGHSTVYEAVNQSEASRSETYMLSSVSDMSDDDFRRSSDVSRQSSSRYAESKPLIRSVPAGERNLLSTISSVMTQQSQSMRLAPHHQRTSILSTISGLRYTDPSLPGQPSLPPITQPVQVTTNVDGEQFVCLNLNQSQPISTHINQSQPISTNLSPDQQGQTSSSTVPADVSLLYPATSLGYDLNTPPSQQQQQLINFGTIQAPVHSQLVIQRVGTLPRQYAHPLAQM